MLPATHQSNTRRGLFAAGVVLPSLFAPNAWAAHPDRDLIRLGERLAALWSLEARLDPDNEQQEAAYYAACREVVEPIVAGHARTWEGLRAKARVVSWSLADDELEAWNASGVTSERAVASIVRDLLRPA